jgi:Uma2 family endonuclease
METLVVTAPSVSAQEPETARFEGVSFLFRQLTSADAFYDFCQDNPDHKFERDPDGHILLMPNTGGKTGVKKSELNADITIWNEIDNLGEVFDSSTAFNLPDGSTRSPDVAWVSRDRWEILTDREQERFPPLCPDFVIELVSPTDSLKTAKAKMTDVWIANGCRLAWLIDPKTQTVHIFRANGEIQILTDFSNSLSGEDVLPGLVLTL